MATNNSGNVGGVGNATPGTSLKGGNASGSGNGGAGGGGDFFGGGGGSSFSATGVNGGITVSGVLQTTGGGGADAFYTGAGASQTFTPGGNGVVSFTYSAVAVPEAGSLALILPALGMAGAVVARKRGAK